MVTNSDDSSALVALAKQGDESALVTLIEGCAGRIVSAIEIAGVSRYSADFDDAQNQALLEIWKSLPALRNETSVCFWMHGVARRVTASRIVDPSTRHRRRADRVRDRRAIRTDEKGPGDTIADRDLLGRVLQELSPQHREVLVLRYLEGFSEAETAKLLSISVKTVSSRTGRAKRAAMDVINELQEVER